MPAQSATSGTGAVLGNILLVIAVLAYLSWLRFRWYPRRQMERNRPDEWYRATGVAALAHLYPNDNEGGFADLRGRLSDQRLSGYAVERIIRLLMADGVLHRRVEEGVEQFALNHAPTEPPAPNAASPAAAGPANAETGPPPGIVFNSGTMYYQHNGGTIQSGTGNTSTTHDPGSGGESDIRRLAEQIASALRQDAAGSTDPAMAQAARHAAAEVEQAAKAGDKNRWDSVLDRIQKLSTAAGPVLSATTQVLTLILGNKA